MLRLPTQALLMLLSGCVSQPTWLASAPDVQCGEAASKECVGEMLARGLSPASPVAAIRTAKAALASVGISDSPALASLHDELGRHMCLRPDQELLLAAESVARARRGHFPGALEQLEAVGDTDARSFALQKIVVLASRSSNEASTATALNLLIEEDEDAYIDGLQARLLDLLMGGDLERAAALRSVLVAHALKDGGDPFHVVEIAVSYLTTGHAADANAILNDAGSALGKLGKDDLLLLVKVLTGAVNGEYPQPQDFFTFSSDEMRLQAYVQLALFYGRTGQSVYARKIASDMSRFALKRSYRADAKVTARAFSRVLIETL